MEFRVVHGSTGPHGVPEAALAGWRQNGGWHGPSVHRSSGSCFAASLTLNASVCAQHNNAVIIIERLEMSCLASSAKGTLWRSS